MATARVTTLTFRKTTGLHHGNFTHLHSISMVTPSDICLPALQRCWPCDAPVRRHFSLSALSPLYQRTLLLIDTTASKNQMCQYFQHDAEKDSLHYDPTKSPQHTALTCPNTMIIMLSQFQLQQIFKWAWYEIDHISSCFLSLWSRDFPRTLQQLLITVSWCFAIYCSISKTTRHSAAVDKTKQPNWHIYMQ